MLNMASVQNDRPLLHKLSYHTFLNFRSKELDKTFGDHLFTALLNAGIRAFRADNEHEDEEKKQNESKKAIQESRVVIIVFSKDYASSPRCLDELVYILDSKRVFGCSTLPVFYDVDPSDVRKQSGEFGAAFARYESKFNEADERQKDWMAKVKVWKAALKEVADLGGMVLQNQSDGEAKFIQKIVYEVGRKLNRTVLHVADHPTGIDSRVKEINTWLQEESSDVGILVIYGIGGIGKSTIAKTAYNVNFDRFECSCFLANIREAAEQPTGLLRLQRQFLYSISKKKKVGKISNVDEGIILIKEAISSKKILLVLDDVADMNQLNAVFGMKEWFYPGSKIIITTRDDHLLNANEVFKTHKVKKLDKFEALQLFSLYAFGKQRPPDDFVDLSMEVAHHCGGTPLALKVLGSSLRGRSLEIWKSAISKLMAIPDSQILEKLRISFDTLPDDHDREMFLDIVCFFVGKDKDYAITVLCGCGFFAVFGLQILIDRCLLTVENDKLRMHQLLQDMGKEIVRQESPWEPWKRSRIFHHKESFNVLKSKRGTAKIKGLILDIEMLKSGRTAGTLSPVNKAKRTYSQGRTIGEHHWNSSKRHRLNPSRHSSNVSFAASNEKFEVDAFSGMHQLRTLLLGSVQLVGSFKQFPSQLRCLHWRGCHFKSIPIDFPVECLVVLDMRQSSFVQVWKELRFLNFLKILNLSHSHDLQKTPNFSGTPNLRRLILKDCTNLSELHESVGALEKLTLLNLRGCKKLRNLPQSFAGLRSLEKLNISGCSRLSISAMELGKLESLTVLQADGVLFNESSTHDRKPWHAIWQLGMTNSNTYSSSNKFTLSSFSRSLISLSLVKCNLLDDTICIDFSNLPSLRVLNLSENPIVTLPTSIKNLTMLKELWVDSCSNLQSFPELPSSLQTLKAVECTSLEKVTNLPNLQESLFFLIDGCERLAEIQGLFRIDNISNYDAEMISTLGDFNSEFSTGTEVELFNKMTSTRKKNSIQGLYEFCIFSTYFPGNEVPTWFDFKGKENYVTLKIPAFADQRILGLNLCMVYRRASDRKYRFWGEGPFADWYIYIKVHNFTKDLKWVYAPTFIGIPGAEELTYLCHWKFGDHLESGDRINVCFRSWSDNIQMKEFGVGLMCETVKAQESEELYKEGDDQEEEQVIEKESRTCQSNQDAIESFMSRYKIANRAYYYSHKDISILRRQSPTAITTSSIVYENLFEDTAEISGDRGSMEDGGGEDDDSSFNFSDYDYDEEMEAAEEEVEMLLRLSD